MHAFMQDNGQHRKVRLRAHGSWACVCTGPVPALRPPWSNGPDAPEPVFPGQNTLFFFFEGPKYRSCLLSAGSMRHGLIRLLLLISIQIN